MNVRENIFDPLWKGIKEQRIFRDRFLRWFVFGAVFFCFLVWILLGFRLRPTGFVVPFEYTSGTEFRFGDWKLIFGYGAFSLLVTIGNLVLAALSFDKSRITSFFLVLSALILNVFTLVVTYTLLAQIG